MLDSYIIEELKRRERERIQRERQRPPLEIPIAPREEDEAAEPQDREPVIPARPIVHIELAQIEL